MLNQSLIHTQTGSLRPITTAHLATTMSLLVMSSEELKQKIEAELSSNPALELTEANHCPTCGRPLSENVPCPVCNIKSDQSNSSPIIFVSPRSDFIIPRQQNQENDISLPGERTAAQEDLPTFVFRQVALDLDKSEIPIATHILTSLDDDGLLNIPLVEIAQYHHIPLSKVNKVQNQIQRSEPIGVGSSSPQDALLVQLDILSETQHVPPLAKRAIAEGMALLSRHSYKELGRLLKISSPEAKEIAHFIAENLNPFPARSYWGNIFDKGKERSEFQTPDFIISQNKFAQDTLIVEIISPYYGLLKINPLFHKVIKSANVGNTEKWQNDLEQARLLIKCLKQRNNTLVRLMKLILEIQHDFILEGDIHLKPLTRASLAKELEVHESTISRAVAGKTIQLPNRRLIPFSKLFDRSLQIRTEIQEIIANEQEPLSDAKITKILRKRGYNVARRTVAKYRSIEGILPARLRHSSNNSHILVNSDIS
jgi:RNA polymerase sigma-54 factor